MCFLYIIICVHLLQLDMLWCDTVHIYCSITCILFNIPKVSQWHSRVVLCCFTWKLKILLHDLFCPLEAAAEFKPNCSVSTGCLLSPFFTRNGSIATFLGTFSGGGRDWVACLQDCSAEKCWLLLFILGEVWGLLFVFWLKWPSVLYFLFQEQNEQMYFTDSHLRFKILRIGWGILSTHNL